MAGEKITLGQAIDQIISALNGLDESARKTALAAVSMQLNVVFGVDDAKAGLRTGPAIAAAQTPASRDETASPPRQEPEAPKKRIDIRSLKDQKRPSSARQMACLVAFYLQELAPQDDRKDAVNAADLEKYFKQAGFKLPTRLGQVLADAKLAGYFDQGARGEYKLNAVGYNLVAHNMPTEQAG